MHCSAREVDCILAAALLVDGVGTHRSDPRKRLSGCAGLSYDWQAKSGGGLARVHYFRRGSGGEWCMIDFYAAVDDSIDRG